jgi:uncharacterized membrane protein YgcG
MREYLMVIALMGTLSINPGEGLIQQTKLDQIIPPSPAPAGFIHDGGPVLRAAEVADLNARISAHQASGRGDIGVAILRDIGDYTANEIGLSIYRAWMIGSVDSMGSDRRDLGALLLIVPKELAPGGMGDCYITTGLGAEGFITDGTAGTICRETIVPLLIQRDYAGARKRRKPRLCPQGHGAMKLLDEKADDEALERGQLREESLKSVDYDVWQCAECGERLVLRYKRWFSSYSECPQCKFWTVKSRTRTLVPATTASGGLAETTRTCQQCGFGDTRQHATPRLSSSSSSSGGRSSCGGSSFGGSGRSAGGGGGYRY